jgi:hypothetical protein
VINYDRVKQAFDEYPMCVGALSKRLDGSPTGHSHAVCAVGALLVSAGAATPAELEGAGTDAAIQKHAKLLKATYGFDSLKQVHALVAVNDRADISDDVVERMQLLHEEFQRRLGRARGNDRRHKAAVRWFERKHTELRLEVGADVYDALVRHLDRLRALGEAKQGRQVARGECPACVAGDAAP